MMALAPPLLHPKLSKPVILQTVSTEPGSTILLAS